MGRITQTSFSNFWCSQKSLKSAIEGFRQFRISDNSPFVFSGEPPAKMSFPADFSQLSSKHHPSLVLLLSFLHPPISLLPEKQRRDEATSHLSPPPATSF